MAPLNGGLMGVMARWAIIEIAPALCPQLYHVCNTNEQLMAGGAGPERKNLQSDPIRITAELRNVGLDPGQEELFWRTPEPSAFRLTQLRVGTLEDS